MRHGQDDESRIVLSNSDRSAKDEMAEIDGDMVTMEGRTFVQLPLSTADERHGT